MAVDEARQQNFLAGADGGDHPVFLQHRAVRERHRLVDVMRDEQNGSAAIAPDIQQEILHARPGLHIQRRERHP